MDPSMSVQQLDGATVAVVAGDLDLLTVPDFGQQLDRVVLGADALLILDLSAVTFLDSSGLSALVTHQKRLAERGATTRLVCAERLLKLFRITRLDQVFTIYESVDAATERVTGPGQSVVAPPGC